uniref:Anti-proliferative protein domain-containing protein n=1 Tax=Clytia hemisphaerica TaxID=252671 RepID=A0A7M5X3Z0_9CNID
MTPNIQIARKTIIPTTSEMKNKKRQKPPGNANSTPNNNRLSSNNKENTTPYDPNSMEHEVEAGVSLILRFVQNSTLKKTNTHGLQSFKERLIKAIIEMYTGHWYPDRPMKGSAFRCLRINQNGSESLIEKTAKNCDAVWIVESLPKEFTVWIDPSEVSYRIGEEGSICVHYARKNNTVKS